MSLIIDLIVKGATHYINMKICIHTSNLNIIFTYSNADLGGKLINDRIEKFCELDQAKYKVFKNGDIVCPPTFSDF